MSDAGDIADDLEFEDYPVGCARCGLAGWASSFIAEEGDEWECPECWDRENARERALYAPNH